MGLTARRLMKQVREIDMENTVERNSSWADPLFVGAGQQVDRGASFDARLEDGFNALLAAEDDSRGPVARWTVATSGMAAEEV